jgi:hypothetical protein
MYMVNARNKLSHWFSPIHREHGGSAPPGKAPYPPSSFFSPDGGKTRDKS